MLLVSTYVLLPLVLSIQYVNEDECVYSRAEQEEVSQSVSQVNYLMPIDQPGLVIRTCRYVTSNLKQLLVDPPKYRLRSSIRVSPVCW